MRACADKLVAVGVTPDAGCEPSLLVDGTRLRRALQGEQRRANEELTADERRDRIPRQPEDEGRLPNTKSERLAGLDRHPPEHLFDAELTENPSHEVMR